MAPKPKVSDTGERLAAAAAAGPSQELHLVLKVRMRLKPPAPDTSAPQEPAAAPPPPDSPSKDGKPGSPASRPKSPPKKPAAPGSARKAAAAAAAAEAAAAAAAALAKPVDPASLVLSVKYTPLAGPEVAAGPYTPVRADAAAAAPAPAPAPAGDAAAGPAAPTSTGAAAGTSSPYATVECEHHARVVVDEAAVRALGAAHGMLALNVSLSSPVVEPEGKKPPASKAKDVPPPTPLRCYSAVLLLDCSGLLVGDTAAAGAWPDKTKGLPRSLEEVAEGVEAELKLLNILAPKQPEAPPAAASPKGAKPTSAKPASAKKGPPPPEPELKDLPGEPTPLLHPALVPLLNPIVVSVKKAKLLPAAPATRAQVDTQCAPPAMFLRWPPEQPPREQPGLSSPWQLPDGPAGPAAAEGPKVSPVAGTRYILFGQPEVFFAGDFPGGGEEALRLCRDSPMLVEVHDRTAIPEPPEFPIEAAPGVEGGEAPPAGDDGYVCGVARVPLLDLSRGYTRCRFNVNIAPHTTIRGAASLDWTKRPGNYAEAGSVLKGEVRCAAPLEQTRGSDPASRVFSRGLFIMDYRDSDLFHLLEDTLRKNNLWRLGLAQPVEKLPPDQMPPEIKAKARALAAAAAAGPVPGSADTVSTNGELNDGHRRRQSSGVNQDAAPGPAGAQPGGMSRRSSSFMGAQEPAAGGSPPRGGLATDRSRSGSMLAAPPIGRRESISPGTMGGDAGLDRARHVLFDSDSDSDSEPDEPPTAAELALDALCVDVDRISLEMRELQALSTVQLTPEQASDPNLDVLTGWHLVDGRERIILVEGLAEGAMKIVKGIVDWALEDPKPEEGWRRRVVLFSASPAVRVCSRLYAPLGADLWISKLRAPVAKLLSEPGSFATGRVRPDCVQGLRRLGALRSAASWARQAHDLSLWPSPQQLQLVDKKFGGELLASDVLGVEVEERDSEDEDGGPAMGGLLDDARSARSSRSARSRRSSRSRKTCKSGRSGRTGKSGRSKGRRQQRPSRMPPLDTRNDAYLAFRREARGRRMGINWLESNRYAVEDLAKRSTHLKDSWREWNPQRAAAEEVLAATLAGTLSLEELEAMHAKQRAQPPIIPGTLPRKDALGRGWYPHPSPFKWPAPSSPADFRELAHKPTDYRVQELSAEWEEGALHRGLSLRGAALQGDQTDFRTAIQGDPTGLFGTDPEYWKTVHLGGVGRAAEVLATKRAEAEEWRRKLVVGDPVMRTTLPVRAAKTAQLDRTLGVLQDEPEKHGIKVAHVPPAPVNSQLGQPWTDPGSAGAATLGRGKDDKTKFVDPGKAFQSTLPKPKSDVHKLAYNQGWTASTKDKYYTEGGGGN